MLLQRAAAGTDLVPVPPRQRSGGGRSKQDGQDKDKQKPPKPERLPSAAEIAAELQRRPLGAIVADICADIGIVPSDLTGEQWDALQFVIYEYGGSLAKLWPAMKNNIVGQMERYAADPQHAPTPQLPLIPWTRQPTLGRPPAPCAHPP